LRLYSIFAGAHVLVLSFSFHNLHFLFFIPQAWKAFVKEIDAIQKKLKKKDAPGALAAYRGAVEKLDAYLSEVELPSAAELK